MCSIAFSKTGSTEVCLGPQIMTILICLSEVWLMKKTSVSFSLPVQWITLTIHFWKSIKHELLTITEMFLLQPLWMFIWLSYWEAVLLPPGSCLWISSEDIYFSWWLKITHKLQIIHKIKGSMWYSFFDSYIISHLYFIYKIEINFNTWTICF